jgi:hypothetical protein
LDGYDQRVKSKEGSNVMYVWMGNSLEIVRICMIQGKCQQLSFGYCLINLIK